MAAYAIRKLSQAGKLSSSFEDKNIKCETFACRKGKKLTRWNDHKIHEIYNLDSPSSRTVNVRAALDLIIHSLAFGLLIDTDGAVEGIFVTSDKKRDNLWLVKLTDFTSLMRHVSRDHPSKSVRIADDKNDDWIEWRGNGLYPPHIAKLLRK